MQLLSSKFLASGPSLRRYLTNHEPKIDGQGWRPLETGLTISRDMDQLMQQCHATCQISEIFAILIRVPYKLVW